MRRRLAEEEQRRHEAEQVRLEQERRQAQAVALMGPAQHTAAAQPAWAAALLEASSSAPGVVEALGTTPPLSPQPQQPAGCSWQQQLQAADSEMLEELECPITHTLMQDPVVAADGMTYERGAIERWLESHDTSPLTGEKLEHKHLLPNNLVRSQIRRLSEAPAARGGRGGRGEGASGTTASKGSNKGKGGRGGRGVQRGR